MNPFRSVVERSGGQCEAMIKGKGNMWMRCWKSPIEVHHMLTKARGGRILDDAGETYHLIALCRQCHQASDGEVAYAGELLIDGYVTTKDGKPFYQGSDEYLSKRYGGKR